MSGLLRVGVLACLTCCSSSVLEVPVSTFKTVFVIVMENHDWSEIQNNNLAPYINDTILPQASYATMYNNNNIHPSLPNYIWIESGSDFGIVDDNPPHTDHLSTTDHLVSYLEKAGISWKAYQEDIVGADCPLSDIGNYAVRHDPFVYFDDVTDANNPSSSHCITHVRPYSELAPDLINQTTAQYNFITPNVCNDMHDTCEPLNDPVAQGDLWLSTNLPMILDSVSYKDGGVVFITWDEGTTGPIGMIVLSPMAKGSGYSNSIHYDHSSLLRTIQEIFNVTPLLRGAATAIDLSDLFTSFPSP